MSAYTHLSTIDDQKPVPAPAGPVSLPSRRGAATCCKPSETGPEGAELIGQGFRRMFLGYGVALICGTLAATLGFTAADQLQTICERNATYYDDCERRNSATWPEPPTVPIMALMDGAAGRTAPGTALDPSVSPAWTRSSSPSEKPSSRQPLAKDNDSRWR